MALAWLWVRATAWRLASRRCLCLSWHLYVLVRMAFGSNGIYVGGKDTFISELSGNWAVHGELAGISVTGAPGPIGRITVELGSAPPQSMARYISACALLRN